MHRRTLASTLLALVLTACSGSDTTLTQEQKAPKPPPPPASQPAKPAPVPPTGTPFTGLRGFNTDGPQTSVPPYYGEMAATGAKVFRFWIGVSYKPGYTGYQIDAGQLDILSGVVAAAKVNGLRVIVMLNIPDASTTSAPLWTSPPMQASMASLWGQIAKAYAGNTTIAGFDLLNEPVSPGALTAASTTWYSVAKQSRDAIRTQDPARTIIVEVAALARPLIFEYGATAVQPWLLDNVVWSIHMYEAFEFALQGTVGPIGYTYPGQIPGTNYPYGTIDNKGHAFTMNKAWLQSVLAPVQAFALANKVPIYVGEFGAVRWSPGATHRQYVADLISIFNAYGWSWTFHAWRGYHGWDYEKDWSQSTDWVPSNAAASPGWTVLLNGFKG